MSGHTPGPWIVTYTRNGTANVGPSHNCTVAALLIAPVGEMEANARLIAAAPLMLEACELFAAYDDADPDDFEELVLMYAKAIDAIRAAIAAATGESA